MTVEAGGPTPYFEQDQHILVIGAGGHMANTAYLPKFEGFGISQRSLSLVEVDAVRRQAVGDKYTEAELYADVDTATYDAMAHGKRISAAYILSNTGAHAENIWSMLHYAESTDTRAGLGQVIQQDTAGIAKPIDGFRVWIEKPVASSESIGGIAQAIIKQDLDVYVGYILRYSDTLRSLQEYLQDNRLTISGLDWVYGKNRRNNNRPTQGVVSDELVHPLSVTDLILSRAFGDIDGMEITSEVKYRPFVDVEVQNKAHINSPEIPRHPTSDVNASMQYFVYSNGSPKSIPVTFASCFMYDRQYRHLMIDAAGAKGHELLTIDFDEPMPTARNTTGSADVFRKLNGIEILRWDGDKANEQMADFLGQRPETVLGDEAAKLSHEIRFQTILSAIGASSLGNTSVTVDFSQRLEDQRWLYHHYLDSIFV
jgi:predicted dehydrogenase